MKTTLLKSYPSRYGVPVLSSVDTSVFTRRYFTRCMECTFCNDACCQYGVDVDVTNVKRIAAHEDALERFTGIPREKWFSSDYETDPEFPGGSQTRTQTTERGCIFLDEKGRGCLLHKYSLEAGLDYHELKPMVSALFPLTFDQGLLQPSSEVLDRTLVCIDNGPTLYRGVRDELLYYFAADFVAELDALELAMP